MLGQKKFLLKVFVKLGLTWVNGVRINLRGGAGRINPFVGQKFLFQKVLAGEAKKLDRVNPRTEMTPPPRK